MGIVQYPARSQRYIIDWIEIRKASCSKRTVFYACERRPISGCRLSSAETSDSQNRSAFAGYASPDSNLVSTFLWNKKHKQTSRAHTVIYGATSVKKNDLVRFSLLFFIFTKWQSWPYKSQPTCVSVQFINHKQLVFAIYKSPKNFSLRGFLNRKDRLAISVICKSQTSSLRFTNCKHTAFPIY